MMENTMSFNKTGQISPATNRIGGESLDAWRNSFSPAIEILRRMTGTTENEFLSLPEILAVGSAGKLL